MYLLYLFITISSDDSILEFGDELATIKVDIVEISEVRRKGEGCSTLTSSTCHRGVGFVLQKKIAGNVTSFEGVSDRLAQLTLKINSKYHLNIIQAFLPTTSHTDEEVDIAVISQQGVTSIITPICLPQT